MELCWLILSLIFVKICYVYSYIRKTVQGREKNMALVTVDLRKPS